MKKVSHRQPMRSDSAILSPGEVWKFSRNEVTKKNCAVVARRLLTQATSIGNDSWKSLHITCITYTGMEGREIRNRRSVCGRFFFLCRGITLRISSTVQFIVTNYLVFYFYINAPRSSPVRKEKKKKEGNERECFSSIVVISESAEAL